MLEITVEIEKSCPLGQMTLQIPDAEISNKTASGVSEFVRQQIEAAIIRETTFNFQTSVGTRKTANA